jgi:hypothetical protein
MIFSLCLRRQATGGDAFLSPALIDSGVAYVISGNAFASASNASTNFVFPMVAGSHAHP